MKTLLLGFAVMVRIDPDKVTPHKDEAASQAYLNEPPRPR